MTHLAAHVQKLAVPQGRVIDAIDVYVEDLHCKLTHACIGKSELLGRAHLIHVSFSIHSF